MIVVLSASRISSFPPLEQLFPTQWDVSAHVFYVGGEIGSPVMSLPLCLWVYFCITVSWIHNNHYIYLLIVV